jgi:hypothetical protein
VVRHRYLDRAAADVDPERQLGEHVGLPGPQQRPRRRLGLGDVRAADPQLEPSSMFAGDRLRPHRAERAAQPGRELLAPVDDHSRCDAVWEVDLRAPAGAVLAHRRRQRRERPLLHSPVDLGDAQQPERPDDDVLGRRLYLRGQLGARRDRPALRPTGERERGEQDQAERHPRPRRREPDHRGHGRGEPSQAQRQDRAARLARLLRRLVDPQVLVQQPVRGGLPLERARTRDVPPGDQPAQDGEHPPHGEPGRLDGVPRGAHAVVRGAVPVPGHSKPDMRPGCFPGPPVGRDDRPPLRLAAGEVDVGGAGRLVLVEAYLGVRIDRAQGYDSSAFGGRIGW